MEFKSVNTPSGTDGSSSGFFTGFGLLGGLLTAPYRPGGMGMNEVSERQGKYNCMHCECTRVTGLIPAMQQQAQVLNWITFPVLSKLT